MSKHVRALRPIGGHMRPSYDPDKHDTIPPRIEAGDVLEVADDSRLAADDFNHTEVVDEDAAGEEQDREDLTGITGVGEATQRDLYGAGYYTVEAVAEGDPDEIPPNVISAAQDVLVADDEA